MKRLILQTLRRVTEPANAMALGIAVLCVVLQVIGLDQILRFDRAAISAGNFWLLLSGNFVQLGSSHLLMNLAGFALVVALVWIRFTCFEYYPKSAGLLLALIIGKLAWEQVAGALPGSESVAGGNVVVNAHLYGAIGGAIIGTILLFFKRQQLKGQNVV